MANTDDHKKRPSIGPIRDEEKRQYRKDQRELMRSEEHIINKLLIGVTKLGMQAEHPRRGNEAPDWIITVNGEDIGVEIKLVPFPIAEQRQEFLEKINQAMECFRPRPRGRTHFDPASDIAQKRTSAAEVAASVEAAMKRLAQGQGPGTNMESVEVQAGTIGRIVNTYDPPDEAGQILLQGAQPSLVHMSMDEVRSFLQAQVNQWDFKYQSNTSGMPWWLVMFDEHGVFEGMASVESIKLTSQVFARMFLLGRYRPAKAGGSYPLVEV